MKYKLINSKTNEEHLCDKVAIHGFDYYVNDEEIIDWYYWSVTGTIQQVKKDSLGRIPRVKDGSRKVIACNNPSVDIPKVIDEVELLAKNCDIEICNASHGFGVIDGFIRGYNKSQETHPFSEEDMVEFADWESSSDEAAKFWRQNRINLKMEGSGQKYKELLRKLLQIWKEQRVVTLYYK